MQLRNGVVLDDVRIDAIVKKPAAPKFETAGGRPNAIFHFSTANSISDDGHPQSSAISVTAQVDAPALSPGDFQAHNIRFMQAVKVAEFTCHFAGTRNSEGSMTYRLKEPHINTFILDCVTGQNFQPRAYPFFNVDATDRISNTYLARLDDAPGFNTATRENNSVTSRWNYLWKFKSSATFLSMLVFVHKDGSLETIGVREWTLIREAKLQWRPEPGGQPTIDTPRLPKLITNVSNLVVTPKISTIGTNDPRDILSLGRDPAKVMNKIGNEAQSNFRTSASMWFKERAEYADGVDDTFWK